MLLREAAVREQVESFFRTAASRHPQSETGLWKAVHHVATTERTLWKQLNEPDLHRIEELDDGLADKSPSGRLRRAVAHSEWRDGPPNLVDIAKELSADRSLLQHDWPWLTSGEAQYAWYLGESLARVDRSLDDVLPSLSPRGPELRVIAGYLYARAQGERSGWLDDWIDRYEVAHPDDLALITELTWRCASTDRGARRLARLARQGRLEPTTAGHLAFGNWSLGPGIDAFVDLADAMSRVPGLSAAVVGLVDHRVSKQPTDWGPLADVIRKLLGDLNLVRIVGHASWEWQQLARRALPHEAQLIARTIFAAQACRADDHRFFIEHSTAAPLLFEAAAANPRGVWDELKPMLSDFGRAVLFVIGFPTGLVDQLPRAVVLDWLMEREQEKRGSILAHLARIDVTDGSLMSDVLRLAGHLQHVRDTFTSEYASGAWSGPASTHWNHRADELQTSMNNSSSVTAREWARQTIAHLRDMAEREKAREEEQRLKWGW